MLQGSCQFPLYSVVDEHSHDLPPAEVAEEAALLCEEPLCDDDSVDSAMLPVPVVLPAELSAGVEVPVAEAPPVATPVGTVPLV